MTVITGPVIPEKKIINTSEPCKINEILSSLHPDAESVPASPKTVSQTEQKEMEVPCFTAPAPVRRRQLPYFGTVLVQLVIALITSGVVWLGLNLGRETTGTAVRSALAFLLNG